MYKKTKFVLVGLYDAAIHVGDMAYDMAELDGHRGDVFMEQIEPIASMVRWERGVISDCLIT